MTKPFKKIAVVGTGTLGAQIAMLASHAGYSVTIFDRQTGAFDTMIEKLHTELTDKQGEPFIPFDQWPACRQQIRQFERL
jgi:3-hydroxyacyl-CoA dehydrogenase